MYIEKYQQKKINKNFGRCEQRDRYIVNQNDIKQVQQT